MKILDELNTRYVKIKDRIGIDKHALDEELVKIGSTFLEVAELHVDSVSVADQAKTERDQAFAAACINARQKMQDAGDKVTEKAVEAAAEMDQTYTTRSKNYRDACEMRDRCEGLRDSFRMRAQALPQLCNLYTGGYFIKNSVTDTKERRDADAERINKEMVSKTKAKK